MIPTLQQRAIAIGENSGGVCDLLDKAGPAASYDSQQVATQDAGMQTQNTAR